MDMFRMMFRAVAFTVVSFALTSLAQAQAPQTFVSAQRGDDANRCSLTDPCRSVERALSEVQAGGDVIIIDSGDYAPFVIKQSVTVNAAPGVHAGVEGDPFHAVTVSVEPADVVVLRGLSLSPAGAGSNNGIRVTDAGSVHVENCVIDGFVRGINFSLASSGQLFVKDTTIRNCNAGLVVETTSGTARATVEHCRLEKSFYGLFAGYGSKVVVRDSVAAGNSVGFRVIANTAGTRAEANIENSAAVGGGFGISAHGGGAGTVVRVSNSTVTDNNTGVDSVAGAALLSRGNNTVEGNTTDGSFTGVFSAK